MRYKVTKNGENIVITDNFKNANEAYNKCIYRGKSGDIIRMLFKKNPEDPWNSVKKDWL